MLKVVGTGLIATPVVTGTVGATHRPEEIDWYEHYIIGNTCTQAVIEDELPPDGNVFKVDKEKALNHIKNDHGWTENEIVKFTTELEKLCLGLEPDQAVLDWYTHKIVACETNSSGDRLITVEDGLGYTFQITASFLFEHLEHDHGWPAEDIEAFRDALDHFCQTN